MTGASLTGHGVPVCREKVVLRCSEASSRQSWLRIFFMAEEASPRFPPAPWAVPPWQTPRRFSIPYLQAQYAQCSTPGRPTFFDMILAIEVAQEARPTTSYTTYALSKLNFRRVSRGRATCGTYHDKDPFLSNCSYQHKQHLPWRVPRYRRGEFGLPTPNQQVEPMSLDL